MAILFQDLFEDMASSLEAPQAELLVMLIDRLRPIATLDDAEIHYRLQDLFAHLKQQPHHARVLNDYVLALLSQYHQVSLYADSGILGTEGFFSSLMQRISWRVLPPLRQENYLHDLFTQCFHRRHDYRWIEHITDDDWHELFTLLQAQGEREDLLIEARNRILTALMIVSYRITAAGLEPEFIRAYPDINEFKSPFLVQNREVIDYIEIYQQHINDRKVRLIALQQAALRPAQPEPVAVIPDYRYTLFRAVPWYSQQRFSLKKELAQKVQQIDARILPLPDEKPALVMLDQCQDIVNRVKKNTRKNGVSISLTNLLIRLDQSLARIELLFRLLHPDEKLARESLAEFLRLMTRAQIEQDSIRALISVNTELLSKQVTENASKVGEHYVSTDKAGFWHMYRSAAGAGLIISIMATLKLLMAQLTLALFSRAFMYSINYSFGFMLIHILHFTVATKQPAMTAAALAATVQQKSGSKKAQLAELAELTINILRTQFIAIIGNISIAMPMACLITWLWAHFTGHALINDDKAQHLLHDLNPFESLALFHAAIAGGWLFLSGLIAGYYDNLAVYHHIGPRLKAHARLQRLLGPQRLERVANYVENNLGALAGNFWFGVMLGSTGTIGVIIGLPIDIRHIAFSSANFVQALMCMDGTPTLGLIAVSFLGVLLIGLTNLTVSFGLALIVALRARRVSFADWKPLFRLIVAHFLTRPSDFFWPPQQAAKPVDKLHKS